MIHKLTLILLVTAMVVCSKAGTTKKRIMEEGKWKVKNDWLKLNYEFTKNSVEVEMEADFFKVSKNLAMQWQVKANTDCPSFVLWWDKQVKKNPSLSVTAGCRSGESEPVMRWELVGDWDRVHDTVEAVSGKELFKFKGIRKFEDDIESFGIKNKFKTLKVISNNGNRHADSFDLSGNGGF